MAIQMNYCASINKLRLEGRQRSGWNKFDTIIDFGKLFDSLFMTFVLYCLHKYIRLLPLYYYFKSVSNSLCEKYVIRVLDFMERV